MSSNQQRGRGRGRGNVGGRGNQFNDSGRGSGGRGTAYNSNRGHGGRGSSQYSNGRSDHRGGQQQYQQQKFTPGNENQYPNRNNRPRAARGDELLSKEQAIQQRTKALQDAFDARPNEFPDTTTTTENKPMLRPNVVNQQKQIWKKVNVQTNLFRIVSKQDVAYQYDLQIRKGKGQNAPAAGAAIYKKIYKILQQQFNWPESTLHDGRSCIYAESQTLEEMQQFRVPLDKDEFYVTVVFAQEIANLKDLKEGNMKLNVRDPGWLVPQECLRVLDTALRHSAIHDIQEIYSVRGRSIFNLKQKGEPLYLLNDDHRGNKRPNLDGNKVYQLLTGYRQSVRVVTEGLVLNLNTIYNMAREPVELLRFFELHDIKRFNQTMSGEQEDLMNKCLKGVKVRYEVPLPDGKVQVRKPTIKCIAAESAYSKRIDVDQQEMNIVEYFYKRYGYKIKYPYLNLVDVSNNTHSSNLLPAELCRVMEGQFERAEGRLQADVIRKAAKFPTVRNKDIDTALFDVNKRIKESPAQFWIKNIERSWLRGIAHVTEPPIIEYGDNKLVKPKNGEWNGFESKLGYSEFFKYGQAKKIESWAVISNWNNDGEVMEFCRNVLEFGQKVGMTIAPLPEQCVIRCSGLGWRSSALDISRVLRNCLEQGVQECEGYFKKKPQMFFVIFSGSSQQYDIVKGLCEGNKVVSPIKVPTQCIQFKTYLGKNQFDNYIKNMMQKVNMKMGGMNFRFFGGEQHIPTGPFAPQNPRQQLFFPMMIMGADVTHPKIAKNSKNQGTSIAAVVASMDRSFVRYSQRISQQCGKQETIEKMEQCTADLLNEFRQRVGSLPKTIVFYRDGVSEGQFEMVLSNEFMAMRRAFKCFNKPGQPDYNPRVTFITVQKRHHWRPQATEDMAADDGDGKRNLAPGTVIDTHGCHPYEFQFLLNSHKTIQGTNHPALYQVLVDQIQFGAEQIILLTYYLTHTYQRCPRSVSIPASVYYAHHACTRGRLLEGQNCTGNMIADEVASCMSWI